MVPVTVSGVANGGIGVVAAAGELDRARAFPCGFSLLKAFITNDTSINPTKTPRNTRFRTTLSDAIGATLSDAAGDRDGYQSWSV